MELRVLAIGALVLLPVVALTVVLSLGDDGPQRLPVTAAVLNQRDAFTAEDVAPVVQAVGYEPGPDLPEQGGEGRAYRLASSTDTDRVARVAAVLGIDGDPVLDGSGSWEVRGGDGAFLGVQSTPGLRWWYAPNERQSPVETLGSEEAVRPDDLPPEDEAVAIAVELLSSMAIDTEGAEVSASDQGTAWTVTVDPTVDGLPTAGFASLVTIGPGGRVLVASGFMATPEAADLYPLADLGTALDRLNAAGGRSVVPPPIMPEAPPLAVVPPGLDCGAMAGGAPTTAAPPPGCEAGVPTTVPAEGVPAATAVPGEHGLEPPEKAVLTSVTRTLIFSASLDGRHGWLVPAYRFDSDNGDRPVVSAVADDFLLDGVSARIDSGGNVGGGAGQPGGVGGVTTVPAPVTSVAPPTTG